MLEANKIYNIDAIDGLKQLDDESVDAFITSPPFNLRLGSNGKPKKLSSGPKWKNYKLQSGYNVYNDAKPHDEYVLWQKTILSECWRCLKSTGAIFYNHKPIIRNGKSILPTSYLPPEVNLRQIITWKRSGGYNFNDSFYLPTTEWILLICKPDFKLKSVGAAGIKDIWEFSCDKNNSHPAPFPIDLPRNVLETIKHKNIVVDPFMGSGTTALACKEVGSNYIGFDISKEYCEIAESRLC